MGRKKPARKTPARKTPAAAAPGRAPRRRGSPPPVEAMLDLLEATHPDAKLALDWEDPFQLLVATILAAQARDDRINLLTPELFRRWPDARAFAAAPLEVLAEALRPTGYFNQKARAVQGASRALVERYGGQVPADLDALVQLPGVGRKTANVVLGVAFGQPDRVAVDTHVKRVSARLGLTRSSDPEEIEADLERLIPAARRTRACHLMQYHGRRLCLARKPRCDLCPLAPLCPAAGTLG